MGERGKSWEEIVTMRMMVLWLLLLVLSPAPVNGEVVRKLIKNSDGSGHEYVFYSKGKEIARQKEAGNGTIIETIGKIPDGTVRQYYDNSSLFGEWNYKGGRLEGISKAYYKSGELRAQWSFRNNVPEGITRWYYKSGRLESEWSYKAGKADGVVKGYYESGTLKAEYNFKDGKKEGIHLEYYENGKIKSTANYKDGTLQSLITVDEE